MLYMRTTGPGIQPKKTTTAAPTACEKRLDEFQREERLSRCTQMRYHKLWGKIPCPAHIVGIFVFYVARRQRFDAAQTLWKTADAVFERHTHTHSRDVDSNRIIFYPVTGLYSLCRLCCVYRHCKRPHPTVPFLEFQRRHFGHTGVVIIIIVHTV